VGRPRLRLRLHRPARPRQALHEVPQPSVRAQGHRPHGRSHRVLQRLLRAPRPPQPGPRGQPLRELDPDLQRPRVEHPGDHPQALGLARQQARRHHPRRPPRRRRQAEGPPRRGRPPPHPHLDRPQRPLLRHRRHRASRSHGLPPTHAAWPQQGHGRRVCPALQRVPRQEGKPPHHGVVAAPRPTGATGRRGAAHREPAPQHVPPRPPGQGGGRHRALRAARFRLEGRPRLPIRPQDLPAHPRAHEADPPHGHAGREARRLLPRGAGRALSDSLPPDPTCVSLPCQGTRT